MKNLSIRKEILNKELEYFIYRYKLTDRQTKELEALITLHIREAEEYWKTYYGEPISDEHHYDRLNKVQVKALVDYHKRQLKELQREDK